MNSGNAQIGNKEHHGDDCDWAACAQHVGGHTGTQCSDKWLQLNVLWDENESQIKQIREDHAAELERRETELRHADIEGSSNAAAPHAARAVATTTSRDRSYRCARAERGQRAAPELGRDATQYGSCTPRTCRGAPLAAGGVFPWVGVWHKRVGTKCDERHTEISLRWHRCCEPHFIQCVPSRRTP